MRESVYCLFQQVLNQRVTLFFNRHIDQIILCCFYIVAKEATSIYQMLSTVFLSMVHAGIREQHMIMLA
ncbi:Retinoblastoma- protein 1 [Dionaea muscipula]